MKPQKKSLDDYLKLPYTIEIIPDEKEGGFAARVVELPGCITQGDTWEEVGEMIADARRVWLEEALENGITIPEPRPQEEYSGKFVVRVTRSLHHRLVEEAERQGVSLNHYISEMLALAVGGGAAKPVEEEQISMVNWPRLSEKARRVLIANDCVVEVQQVDERFFADWAEDCLNQVSAALESRDHQAALFYSDKLCNSLKNLANNSPLVATYYRTVTLLQKQILENLSLSKELHKKIFEQNTVSPSIRDQQQLYDIELFRFPPKKR